MTRILRLAIIALFPLTLIPGLASATEDINLTNVVITDGTVQLELDGGGTITITDADDLLLADAEAALICLENEGEVHGKVSPTHYRDEEGRIVTGFSARLYNDCPEDESSR